MARASAKPPAKQKAKPGAKPGAKRGGTRRSDPPEVSLVLGAGNALGAYHLGVCGALLESGTVPEPAWLTGASIGAVTAAILAGNPPDRRLARLRAFWDEAVQKTPRMMDDLPEWLRVRYNNDHALAALLFGRPGLFNFRLPGLWSLLPGMPPDVALHDHAPMAETLPRLIDFDRLNEGKPRVSVVTLDMETGEEVWFDNRTGRIEVAHLLAATALAPLYPPVEIDGRLLCDAGYANSVPLDRVFREPPTRDQLCIAVELYSLEHGRPATLDQTIARVQDIGFSSQTRRSIDALARECALRRRCDAGSPAVTLAHVAYRAPGHQRTLKPLDFSPSSMAERIAQGRDDMAAMLPRLATQPPGADWTYLGPHASRLPV